MKVPNVLVLSRMGEPFGTCRDGKVVVQCDVVDVDRRWNKQTRMELTMSSVMYRLRAPAVL